MQNSQLPLEGLQVVELGTVAAVPRSARVLAAFGADVIKVEALSGDDYRFLQKVPNQYNTLFTLENSNKRFVSIDLKNPEGKETFLKLLENADVFITNVRLKSLKKLGIDYENMKNRFPELIYAHFSGFGTKGPAGENPGYDSAAFWARSGASIDIVRGGSDPVRPPTGFGDLATSSAIIAGVMMALYARANTGKGTLVSSSLFSSGIWCSSTGIVLAQDALGMKFPDDFDAPLNPFGRNYQCKDGEWVHLNFSRYNARWERNCAVFGLEEYRDDERFSTVEKLFEGNNRYELTRILKERFLTKPQEEWLKILQEEDVVFAKVNHLKDVPFDEQAWENDYLEEVDFEKPGKVIMPRPPMQFSEYGIKNYCPTGKLGEHTREVLSEISFSEEDIDRLAREGVIVTGEEIDKVKPEDRVILL